MALAYSVQFVLGPTPNARTYLCPAGKRAVLKCIMGVNTGTTGLQVSADIDGTYIWYGTIPGASQLTASGLHVVFNTGQVLKLAGGAAVHVVASGFLLDNT